MHHLDDAPLHHLDDAGFAHFERCLANFDCNFRKRAFKMCKQMMQPASKTGQKRGAKVPVDRTTLPAKKNAGIWVQTERAAHEAWAALIARAPKAAQLMHILTARIGEHNAVIISQKTLMTLMGCSRPTVQRALDVLAQDRWIEVRRIGESGTVNAYVINDRVAWATGRDGLKYSLFSAAVVLTEEEQPDKHELGGQEPLRKVPSLFRGEQQLPHGAGLPPPSQPFLHGMEPELPSTEVGGDDLP